MKIKKIVAILLIVLLSVSTGTTAYAAVKKHRVQLYNYFGVKFRDFYIKSGGSYKTVENMNFTDDLKFVKWSTSLTNIRKNIVAHPVYRVYVPHVMITKKVAVGDKFNFGTNVDTFDKYIVEFKSSNPKVVTIDKKGMATALADGKSVVSFRAYKTKKYKGKAYPVNTAYFECEIIVDKNEKATPYEEAKDAYDRPVADSPTLYINDNIRIGETIDLSKSLDLQAGDNVDYYSYSLEEDEYGESLEPNITEISTGKFKAIRVGKCKTFITVWDYDKSLARYVVINYTIVEE